MALCKPLVDRAGLTPLEDVDWRHRLPVLRDGRVTLREVRRSDTASLVAHLHRPRVLRFMSECPSTPDGFARFVRWARSERRRGRFACYGIVPAGALAAVGVIQFWSVERDFSTAEWGFALGQEFWGTGLFTRSARLALDAAFSQMRIYRLEARAVDVNEAGNRALARLGARREGTLRGGFRNGHIVRDHVMWSILAPEWEAARNGCTVCEPHGGAAAPA